MRLVLLGPPGAGKGTQAKQLAIKLNLPHISTGDILRRNVSEKTELGVKAKDFMDKGLLVPDTLMQEMLNDRFGQPDIRRGFILDGYPRNLRQAQNLDEILKTKNTDIDGVVYLDTSLPVIVQRLTGRLVCSVCAANFHIRNMPPEKEGVCDNCGGKLYQRSDDTEETVKKRIQVYEDEAASLIDYYEQKKKLYRLNADEDARVVLDKIIEIAHKYNDSPKV